MDSSLSQLYEWTDNGLWESIKNCLIPMYIILRWKHMEVWNKGEAK